MSANDRRVVREMVAARYRCHGRGDCCRSYPTISLTPADVHRVCATLHDEPTLTHRSHRVFLPTVGSAPTPMRAVSLVDGACRFLDGDGGCAVHGRGGAEAKPVGCAWFPTRLVDDGVEVRAAPAVECLCPARPDPTASPLVPVLMVSELPLGVTLVRVPERVRIGARAEIDRARAIETLDRLVDRTTDPARLLWTWGRALARADAWCEPADSCALDTHEIALRFAAVAARAVARTGVETTWRATDDVVCRRLQVIGLAAGLLTAPTAVQLVVDTAGDAALERHVLEVAVFSRSLLVGDEIAAAACDLALQMWLARAVTVFVDASHDVTLREAPLAAVAATWRAQRLGQRRG